MAELSAEDKRARILEVDAIEPSPTKRAQAIYAILHQAAPELNEWDIICFCIEYLGKLAFAYPWLSEFVKPIARIVYTAHYFDEQTDIASGIKSPTGDKGSDLTGERQEDRPRTLFEGDKPR